MPMTAALPPSAIRRRSHGSSFSVNNVRSADSSSSPRFSIASTRRWATMIVTAPYRSRWFLGRHRRPLLLLLPLAALFIWLLLSPASVKEPSIEDFPLVKQYIQDGKGDGGRWYIPPSWYEMDSRFLQEFHHDNFDRYMDIRNPRSPAEAAQFALELCLRRGMFLANSKIPLIVHQTWKNSDTATWSKHTRRGAEEWLRAVTSQGSPNLPQLAYIFWDDDAIDELINVYEPGLVTNFHKLPYPVAKADIFRVTVLKWFGGIYADIDTSPLQHPSQWVHSDDLKEWKDPETQRTYGLYKPSVQSYNAPAEAPFRPRPLPDSASDLTPASYVKMMSLYKPDSVSVAAIVGIEADTPADTDDYWRSGYTFSVQLTNWAMALAPHHPIATEFMARVATDIKLNMSHLREIDPVTLTGPVALTKIVKQLAERETPSFVWQSLSSIGEAPGGSGKIAAGDVLVLPITAFSPGRAEHFHNMGSQPTTHPNARLYHIAQGSWRGHSVKVETGKFCRTFLGGCRDWRKIP